MDILALLSTFMDQIYVQKMVQLKIGAQKIGEKLGRKSSRDEGPRRINLNVTPLTTFKIILLINVQIELEFLPSCQGTKTHFPPLFIFYFPGK